MNEAIAYTTLVVVYALAALAVTLTVWWFIWPERAHRRPQVESDELTRLARAVAAAKAHEDTYDRDLEHRGSRR